MIDKKSEKNSKLVGENTTQTISKKNKTSTSILKHLHWEVPIRAVEGPHAFEFTFDDKVSKDKLKNSEDIDEQINFNKIYKLKPL